ncbi:MAG: hypothetical protein ABFD90_01020 [Phycisphaerales bacterium]
MSDLRMIMAGAVSVCLFGSGVLCLPAAGRDVKLVLHPQKAPAEVGEFSLLPPESAMIDGDAVPLYEKAAKALPDKAEDDQIRNWLDVPIDQLPLDQVEQALSKRMESLKCVAKAVKCRQCNWPETPDLSVYRRLAFVVRLWARLEIANDGYEGAILALQTGFGMARHLGQTPTIVQGLVATAVGAFMCEEVEELVQREGAPNLCVAMAGLPIPFVQMDKAIENERASASSQGMMDVQMNAGIERARVIVKRLHNNLAALQCAEAIRLYAASHAGKLPRALADMTEVSIPANPVGDGPFHYSLTGSTAVLESALSAGADEKERIRYEISIKN